MKQTRAKFLCTEISKQIGWGENKFVYAAKFRAVTSNSEENTTFFAATPSGNIEVHTIREDHFEVGKEYYVDFTLPQ